MASKRQKITRVDGVRQHYVVTSDAPLPRETAPQLGNEPDALVPQDAVTSRVAAARENAGTATSSSHFVPPDPTQQAWAAFAKTRLTFTEEDNDVDGLFHNRKIPVASLARPKAARGRCLKAAEALVEHLNGHGITAEVHTYGYDGSHGKDSPHGVWVHAAVSVQQDGVRHVIDPTFRQFDAQSVFPLMEPQQDYDQRMAALGYSA